MRKVFIFVMVILALSVARVAMAASVHLIDSSGVEYSSTNPIYITQTDPNNLQVIIKNGGTARYSIKRTNIDPNTSVNLAFTDPNGSAFTSRIINVYADQSNTQDVVIDWHGGTAVAPSANTAGDDLLSPGESITLDNFYTSSISVISAGTGSQTFKVRAWR